MTNIDNDDQLLQDFFATRREDLPDDGFTDRVMERIAVLDGMMADTTRRQNRRIVWLNRIWTAACVLLIVALFWMLDAGQLIFSSLKESLQVAIEANSAQFNPVTWGLAGVVLLFFCYKKVASMA